MLNDKSYVLKNKQNNNEISNNFQRLNAVITT